MMCVWEPEEKPPRHQCPLPEATYPLKSLALCDYCGKWWVVGWVDGGLAYVPGWKRLRLWHLPSLARRARLHREAPQNWEHYAL